ncbi:MAG: ATP-binding protein [Nitrosomonas sp.]|nr:ATP-binding protein [Nitrosomonas sp.]
MTSKQPFSQWDQIFPDTMMTVAAIDRIIHHATIIEINSKSYRRKNVTVQRSHLSFLLFK